MAGELCPRHAVCMEGTELRIAVAEAGYVELRIRVRIVLGSSAGASFDTIAALAAQHDADVEVVEIAEPFETPARSPIVDALASALERVRGARPALAGMPAWTDAHSFVELAGSHAIVFGPGRLSDAHRPDEAVDVTEIVEAAAVLAELLAAAPRLVE